jgi:tRNA pseudouridine55 synthase
MILNLYKPAGWTSFDVVRKIRSITGEKKVGHGGTLDPFAEGVLVVATGSDTKRLTDITQTTKSYQATLLLGIATDTLDLEGTVTERKPVPDLTPDQAKTVLASFEGPQTQVPPMFSAKKVNGVPLYKLARKQQVVERDPCNITIHAIEFLGLELPRLTFSVVCSKGTYIRVLGADISRKLCTVGHLVALRRLAVGEYKIEDSITIEAFQDTWISTAA